MKTQSVETLIQAAGPIKYVLLRFVASISGSPDSLCQRVGNLNLWLNGTMGNFRLLVGFHPLCVMPPPANSKLYSFLVGL